MKCCSEIEEYDKEGTRNLLIIKDQNYGNIGLRMPDTQKVILIKFCPWCGEKITNKPSDERFFTITKPSVHELIDNMDISSLSKEYFDALQMFQELSSSIFVGKDMIEQCRANWEKIRIDEKNQYFNLQDFVEYIETFICMKAKYLKTFYPNHEATLYFWYGFQDGYFSLSIISSITKELPFGCTLVFVNQIEEIINEFTQDPCRGIIPKSELVELFPGDEGFDEDDEDQKSHKLKIYAVSIPNIKRL
jgi:hypothetical protein